jgi:hypothetical protein
MKATVDLDKMEQNCKCDIPFSTNIIVTLVAITRSTEFNTPSHFIFLATYRLDLEL